MPRQGLFPSKPPQAVDPTSSVEKLEGTGAAPPETAEATAAEEAGGPGTGATAMAGTSERGGAATGRSSGAAAAAGDCRTHEYWRRLAPQLAGGPAFRFGETQGTPKAAADVAEEGYAVLTSEEWTGRGRAVVRGKLMAKLEAAILALGRAGWPATFVIVYDAVWDLLRQAGPLCRGAAGPNAFNGDILAWCVDPAKGQSGFSPHRDRQPEDVAASFRADGTPRYATMWIAVTPATPHNSCLYMLPRHCDPGYLAGDTDAERDPLQVALKDKEAFQNIRAVPLDRGDAVLFTVSTCGRAGRGRELTNEKAPHHPLGVRREAGAGRPAKDLDLVRLRRVRVRTGLLQGRCASRRRQPPSAGAAPGPGRRADDRVPPAVRVLGLRPQDVRRAVRGAETPLPRVLRAEGAGGAGGRVQGGARAGWEEAEEDEDDVLDAALEKMLDAKMDGMGDFDDDFDDEGLAVEGPGDDDGEGASDGADEEEDDVLERMLGGARASKKPRVA